MWVYHPYFWLPSLHLLFGVVSARGDTHATQWSAPFNAFTMQFFFITIARSYLAVVKAPQYSSSQRSCVENNIAPDICGGHANKGIIHDQRGCIMLEHVDLRIEDSPEGGMVFTINQLPNLFTLHGLVCPVRYEADSDNSQSENCGHNIRQEKRQKARQDNYIKQIHRTQKRCGQVSGDHPPCIGQGDQKDGQMQNEHKSS